MSRRWTHGLVAVLACLAMVLLHGFTGEFPHEQVTRTDLGKPGRLHDSTVTVNSSTIGQLLYEDSVFVGRSPVVFLAVNVTIATDGRQKSSSWQVSGAANQRSFAARQPLWLPEPGFRITQDVVFELSPDDLAGFTVRFLDRAPIYAYDPAIEVDLGISAADAAALLEQNRYATVRASRGRAEVNR
ncbi:MAG: hypothetical protein QM582_07655 [Micropruina sp.]|uniref:hypothetical protein n=1 Tax=Micropruina sp. TaxID=2737536 RepID=UPI0039E501B7